MFSRPSTASVAAFVFLLAAGFAPARAELKWAAPDFTGTLGPGQESLATRFTFKNTGTTPVRVTEVRASCGCTTGKVDQLLYQPGQSGVLTVTFAAAGSVGLKEEVLYVTTDEPGREPYPVTLKITIAEWLALTPRFISWPTNSPASAQSARLTLDPAAGASVLRVTSSSPAFAVRLLPPATPDSAASLVEITPASTGSPARAVINVVVLLPSGQELNRTVHVRVR
jgi:hypothetical protein